MIVTSCHSIGASTVEAQRRCNSGELFPYVPHVPLHVCRNDVILAQACRDDVSAFCKDVEPGAHGVRVRAGVHACAPLWAEHAAAEVCPTVGSECFRVCSRVCSSRGLSHGGQ